LPKRAIIHLMKESWPGTPKNILDADFYSRFSDEDQRLMHNGEWDYVDSETLLNKLKAELEATDDTQLTEEQLSDKENALWLWYHHASQMAYAKHKDTQTALDFIDKALMYRERIGLDNQITPLLKLLYLGDTEEARKFAENIPETVVEKNENCDEAEVVNVEKETAFALVSHFEKKAESK
jgi:hypothetical protein